MRARSPELEQTRSTFRRSHVNMNASQLERGRGGFLSHGAHHVMPLMQIFALALKSLLFKIAGWC
jgi:hypothetical protein